MYLSWKNSLIANLLPHDSLSNFNVHRCLCQLVATILQKWKNQFLYAGCCLTLLMVSERAWFKRDSVTLVLLYRYAATVHTVQYNSVAPAVLYSRAIHTGARDRFVALLRAMYSLFLWKIHVVALLNKFSMEKSSLTVCHNHTRVVQKVLPLAKTKQYLQMCFILTLCTVRINNITKNSSQVPCVITKIMIY